MKFLHRVRLANILTDFKPGFKKPNLPKLRNLNRGRSVLVTISLVILFIAAIPVYLYLKHPAEKAAAWYNDAWVYRKQLTVDPTKVSGSADLTNFPILVSRTDTDLITKAQSDGDDIVFTDTSGVKLDHEIERFTAGTGELIAWVRIPTLKGADYTTIYMYYGNPNAANQQNPTGVWDDSYVAVYHFTEGSGAYLDSTKNNNDTTTQNVTSRTATGIAGYGPDFEDTANNTLVVPDSNSLDIGGNALTVEAWFNPESLVTTASAHRYVFCKEDSVSGYQPYCLGTEGTGTQAQMYFDVYASNGTISNARANVNLATATNYYFAGVLPGQNQNLLTYMDGSLSANYTATFGAASNLNTSNSSLDIGRGEDLATLDIDGVMDEVRISRTNRSADWLATTYETVKNPSTFFTTVGSEEVEAGPVLWLSFDEMHDNGCSDGADVCDKSEHGNNASFAASSVHVWEEPEMCVTDDCVMLKGNPDSANISDNNSLDFGTGSFTIQAWVRKMSGTETDHIISKWGSSGTDGGYTLAVTSTGQFRFDLSDNSTENKDEAIQSGGSLDNKWHFVTGVKNGTSNIQLYVDGKLKAWDNSLASTGTISNSDPFWIAQRGDANNYFNGTIDEVKVYPYARSATEIVSDYTRSSSVRGVSESFGSPSVRPILTDGLVAWWRLDEQGTTGPVDSGDQWGFDLYRRGAAPGVVMTTGKFGNGGDFESSTPPDETYVYRGDYGSLSITGNLTIAAWIKPESNTAATQYDIAGKWDTGLESYMFAQYGDELRMYIDSASNYAETTTTNLVTGTWYFVVGTYDATAQTVQFYVNGVQQQASVNGTIPASIGDDASSFYIGAQEYDGATANTAVNGYDGMIDEVRLYNVHYDQTDVTALYNFVPGPVGWWKMDETSWTNDCSTATVFDSSGYGINGVSCLAGTGPVQTIPGKYGRAGNLTRSDDYITISDGATFSTNSYTMEGWVSMTGDTEADEEIFSNRDASGDGTRMLIGGSGNNQIQCMYNAVSLNSTDYLDNMNLWYHVACTSDGSTLKVYVNGHNSAQAALTGNIAEVTNARIGVNAYSTSYDLPGRVDDFRFYNYARTDAQLVADMNAGHPAPGSPVGSALLYLKFDEGYGDTAYDSGYGGNNADLVVGATCPGGSTACPTWTNDGKIGKALSFDGSDDYLFMGNTTPDVDIPGDLSIAFWIKPRTIQDGEYIVYKGENGGETEAENELFFLRWDTTSGNDIEYGHEYGAGTDDYHIFDTNMAIGSWYYVTLVRDTTANTVSLYVDNRLIQTQSYASDPTGGTSGEMAFGSHDNISGNYLDAILDEFRLYSVALTPDQVAMLYNQGATAVFGSLSTGLNGEASNSASRSYCPPGNTESNCAIGLDPGPSGEWNFDENTGNTYYDKTGSGNTLTSNVTNLQQPSWVPGKNGSAVLLDGSNDYLNASAYSYNLQPTHNVTVEAWIKPTRTAVESNNDQIIANKNLSGVASCSTVFQMWVDKDSPNQNSLRFNWTATNGTQYTSSSYASGVGTQIVANEWQHVAAVVDGATIKLYINGTYTTPTVGAPVAGDVACDDSSHLAASSFRISNSSSVATFPGYIDEMRVYTYARTPAQIAWDYNRGAPIVWYKFDECQGDTAYNSAPGPNGIASGLTGNISIGPGAAANNKTGSCTGNSTDAWYNGIAGKYNTTLDFDGTNDYASASSSVISNITNFSVSTWINQDTQSGSWDEIANDFGDGAGDARWWLAITNANQTADFAIQTSNCSGGSTSNTRASTPLNAILTGIWYHLVGTYDGTWIKLYLNGQLSQSTKYTTGLPPTTCGGILRIGAIMTATVSNFYDGKIDDFRLYNYALSDTQVKTVYNEGSAVRFGPLTGSP